MTKDNKKSLPEIISEVCSEICDKYCKYTDIADGMDGYDAEIFLKEKCTKCPLNRLD